MKKKITWLLAAAFTGIVAFSGVCQADGMSVDKEDGEYSIQVDLEGGSGKASVTSPTILTVEDGKAYAQIQWSSSNYDYMIVDGEKYLPTNEEGMNSVFEIPVLSMATFRHSDSMTQSRSFCISGMSVLKVRVSASGSVSTAPLTRQATMISR